MARPQAVSAKFSVEIDGSEAKPPKPQPTHVEVEQHVHLPDAFALTYADNRHKVLKDLGIDVGSKVKIVVSTYATDAPVPLIEGEVTALDAEFHGEVSRVVVRGFDAAHRLSRGTNSAAHLNMSYSDLVRKIAKRHDLDLGTIDGSPAHDHVTQANESDWNFLSRLAEEVGYQLTVVDQKLNFCKASTASSAPDAHDLSSDAPLAFAPGTELHYLRSTVTAAQQTKQVEVVGYDQRKKSTMHATAETKTESVTNGSSSQKVAEAFPSSSLVATGQHLRDDKAAEQAAKVKSDRLAASQTELEGEVRGSPKLKAGAAITFTNLGKPFDGDYVVSTTRHVYDSHRGYATGFTVSGRQDRSTLALTGGSAAPIDSIDGVVPAEVDDVDDPDHLGRVRLRFPWMSPTYVSDWSPVMQLGAGKDRGLHLLPEAHDQVLVSFAQGDVRRPFVLGGIHNEQDTPKKGPGPLLDGKKLVNHRMLTSRLGHQIQLVDADDQAAIVLHTANNKLVIKLDQAHNKVEIHSDGDLVVTAGGKLDLKGGSVNLQATSGDVEVHGNTIKLN